MKLIEELIAGTPSRPIREVSIFARSAFAQSDSIGLAGTPPDYSTERAAPNLTRSFVDTIQLAQLARSTNVIESTLGICGINSLLNTPDRLHSHVGVNAFDLAVEMAEGKTIGVIGGFPKAKALAESKRFRDVFVFELFPREPHHRPASDMVLLLPECEFVLLTATTLCNGTFEGLCPLIKHSFNVMVGPSTPLSPVLFDYGIDALCGSVVIDVAAVRADLSQGLSFRQCRGLTRVTWKK